MPKEIGRAKQLSHRTAAKALQPDPLLTVSEWADKHRRLSTKASSEAGAWRTSRTPYLKEIMDAMSVIHPCADSVFMKGTQIGGSEALYNCIGYVVDQSPCPVMLVMPTSDTGRRVSKQRLQPIIEETDCLSLSNKFADGKSRVTSNTIVG
jgi:phage terminase large subunit GpA-like protein